MVEYELVCVTETVDVFVVTESDRFIRFCFDFGVHPVDEFA